MDFTTINDLLDATVKFILASADNEKTYQQQIADKDKQIADLQGQLATATSTINADETELTTLHDKLAQLSGVINPAPAPAPAPAAA